MIEQAEIDNTPATKQRDPLRVLAVMARRKGDVFVYATGPPLSFLVNRPDHVRHVLVDGASRYSKETPMNTAVAEHVARGLLTSEGDAWRRQRHLMQPVFHRRNTPALAHVVASQFDRMLERWAPTADGSFHVDAYIEFTRLLFRITSIALFHVDPTAWEGNLMPMLHDALLVLAEEDERDFRVARHILTRVSQEIVNARMELGSQRLDDALGRLIKSGEPEGEFDTLWQHVINMALAGYETTASVVTWATYALAQRPELAAATRARIEHITHGRNLSLHDLRALPELTAIVKETMRLYPPAWIIGRRALEDDRIGDVDIPRNSVVAISPYTMHRHPQYWDEPEQFDPTRFLGDAEREREPFTYIPFGAGPRTCIGTNFALVEAPLIIGELLQRFSLELVDPAPVAPRGVFVIVPERPINLRLTPRR
ncbi:MAG TPA: cytochrome P450 [Dehalococcoidia bacterium]|nr:cytochrome P450 [Dehalococcoidia bacterium]